MSEETTTNETQEVMDNTVEEATEEVTATEETPETTAEETAGAAPAAEATEEAPAAEETAAPAKSLTLEELKPGMSFEGKVKSVELYGAFVDIGVGKDALLHISQLGKTNVKNVEDVVKKGDTVTVYVLKVDPENERIALSTEKPPENPINDLRVGAVVTGKVVRIENFGVFVEIGAERPGMIHVSELATEYIESPESVVKMNEEVTARIIKVNRKKRQIDLSIKALEEESQKAAVAEAMAPDDEPMPTAMELALRRAMTEAGEDRDTGTDDKKQRNSRKKKQALDDVLSRTLKEHGN